MNDNGSEIYKALFRGPDLLVRSGYSGTRIRNLPVPFWLNIEAIRKKEGIRTRNNDSGSGSPRLKWLDPSSETVSTKKGQRERGEAKATDLGSWGVGLRNELLQISCFLLPLLLPRLYLPQLRPQQLLLFNLHTKTFLSEMKGSGFESGSPRIHIDVDLLDPDLTSIKMKKAKYR